MRRVIRLLAIVAAISGAIWLDNARKRAEESGEPLGDVLRRDFKAFMSHRFDPMVMRFGLAGGERSIWGVVEQTGRTTGTVYHTPVYPLVAEDQIFIRLPFGADVDWSRNIRAAGHCRLQFHETIYELDEPAVVGPRECELVPERLQGLLERTGRKYLRLHILDQAPGTFAHAPAEAAKPPLDVHGEHLEMVPPAHEAEPAPTQG